MWLGSHVGFLGVPNRHTIMAAVMALPPSLNAPNIGGAIYAATLKYTWALSRNLLPNGFCARIWQPIGIAVFRCIIQIGSRFYPLEIV